MKPSSTYLGLVLNPPSKQDWVYGLSQTALAIFAKEVRPFWNSRGLQKEKVKGPRFL